MKLFIRIKQELKFLSHEFGLLQSNWLIGLLTKFTWLAIILSLAMIIWRWSRFPPEVPLWYAKPWGSDRLAAIPWLFILPLGSLVWYLINLLIATYLTRAFLIFTQLLFLTSFFVSLLSLFTLTKIVFLVT